MTNVEKCNIGYMWNNDCSICSIGIESIFHILRDCHFCPIYMECGLRYYFNDFFNMPIED